MMLLANEVVAIEVKEREVPCIHRIHGSPDDKKIEKFAKLAKALGYDISAEDARDPKKLSKFLGTIDGTEQAPVLRYLLLRSMQQASYDIDELTGHFGLAAKDYLHFTSPIRRYPDLTVHRIVKRILRREHIDAATLVPKLTRFSADASRLERRAITVERHVIDLYRAILMRDRMGEEFDAAVSSVDPGGIYVRFDEPFVEAFIPIERLDDDYYELGDLGIRLIGTRTGRSFALGDKIRVRLEDINISRRQLLAVPTSFGPPRQRPVAKTGQRAVSRKRDDKKSGGKKKKKDGGRESRARSGNTSHAAPRKKKDDKPKRTRSKSSKGKKSDDGGKKKKSDGGKKKKRTR
jgi:ribonuclease R